MFIAIRTKAFTISQKDFSNDPVHPENIPNQEKYYIFPTVNINEKIVKQRAAQSIGLGCRVKFVESQNRLKEKIMPSFALDIIIYARELTLTKSSSYESESSSRNISSIMHDPKTRIENANIHCSRVRCGAIWKPLIFMLIIRNCSKGSNLIWLSSSFHNICKPTVTTVN